MSLSTPSVAVDNMVVSNGNSLISLSIDTSATDSDVKWQEMVNKGEALLHAGQPKEAIEKYFDPVIEQFNLQSQTNSAQIFCARDSKESLIYMLHVAVFSEDEKLKDIPVIWGARFAKQKDGAVVLPQFWAEALYLKSYALVELDNMEKAKEPLQTAIGLSPLNFQYLAELGYIYQMEKNWDMALEVFKASEEATKFSSPDEVDAQLARAWRGLAYVYVEQGKLHQAKEKYQQCLKLNKNDDRALAELQYIEQLEEEQ